MASKRCEPRSNLLFNKPRVEVHDWVPAFYHNSDAGETGCEHTDCRQTGTSVRCWLIYLLASLGRGRSETYVRDNAPHLLPDLAFFWDHHEANWTNRLDVADQIDFLRAQYLG